MSLRSSHDRNFTLTIDIQVTIELGQVQNQRKRRRQASAAGLYWIWRRPRSPKHDAQMKKRSEGGVNPAAQANPSIQRLQIGFLAFNFPF